MDNQIIYTVGNTIKFKDSLCTGNYDWMMSSDFLSL